MSIPFRISIPSCGNIPCVHLIKRFISCDACVLYIGTVYLFVTYTGLRFPFDECEHEASNPSKPADALCGTWESQAGILCLHMCICLQNYEAGPLSLRPLLTRQVSAANRPPREVVK